MGPIQRFFFPSVVGRPLLLRLPAWWLHSLLCRLLVGIGSVLLNTRSLKGLSWIARGLLDPKPAKKTPFLMRKNSFFSGYQPLRGSLPAPPWLPTTSGGWVAVFEGGERRVTISFLCLRPWLSVFSPLRLYAAFALLVRPPRAVAPLLLVGLDHSVGLCSLRPPPPPPLVALLTDARSRVVWLLVRLGGYHSYWLLLRAAGIMGLPTPPTPPPPPRPGAAAAAGAED